MPMLPKAVCMEDEHGLRVAAGGGLGAGLRRRDRLRRDDLYRAVCEWIARFYKNESCGKCVPCRIGTDWIYKIIDRIENGQGRRRTSDLLRSVCVNLGGERMMDSRSSARLATPPPGRSSGAA